MPQPPPLPSHPMPQPPFVPGLPCTALLLDAGYGPWRRRGHEGSTRGGAAAQCGGAAPARQPAEEQWLLNARIEPRGRDSGCLTCGRSGGGMAHNTGRPRLHTSSAARGGAAAARRGGGGPLATTTTTSRPRMPWHTRPPLTHFTARWDHYARIGRARSECTCSTTHVGDDGCEDTNADLDLDPISSLMAEHYKKLFNL